MGVAWKVSLVRNCTTGYQSIILSVSFYHEFTVGNFLLLIMRPWLLWNSLLHHMNQRRSFQSSGLWFYFSLQVEAAVLLSLSGRESLFFACKFLEYWPKNP